MALCRLSWGEEAHIFSADVGCFIVITVASVSSLLALVRDFVDTTLSLEFQEVMTVWGLSFLVLSHHGSLFCWWGSALSNLLRVLYLGEQWHTMDDVVYLVSCCIPHDSVVGVGHI